MTTEVSAYLAHPKDGGDPQTLEAHLLGVSTLAKGFADKVGLKEQGELVGLLHDLGKYSD